MLCSIHHTKLICPRCVGAKGGARGGKATTVAKVKAARKNIIKAVAARTKAKKVVSGGSRCRTREECFEYMKGNPGVEIRVEDLLCATELSSHPRGRHDASKRLFDLFVNGKIEKAGRGVYIYNPPVGQN